MTASTGFPSLAQQTVARATLNPALLRHAWSAQFGRIGSVVPVSPFLFHCGSPFKRKLKVNEADQNQIAVVWRAGGLPGNRSY